MKKQTGIKKTPDEIDNKNNTDNDNSTKELKNDSDKSRKIEVLKDNADELVSVQAMRVLKGFAPLGMLFVLMDVMNGGEEGLIRVNRLSDLLSIGKPAMLAQLGHLENAGLIRTVSSSHRGRHVELLTPNLMSERILADSFLCKEMPSPALCAIPEGAPLNFSPDVLAALQAYLSARGIRVASLPDESGIDPRVPRISSFLGKYFPHVQPFYARLKATLNEGEDFQFSLRGLHGRDVTHILNFCRMLRDVGYLAVFSYRRAPHYAVAARVSRIPAAINFLSGGWLEHYIRDKVVSVLETHPATLDTPFAFMKNPKIVLPGDEDFEFDFLLMVRDKIFWIEAKTGEYMNYLEKYSRVAKLLGLNRNNNLLVLSDAPKPDANVSARYGISCCGVDEFASVFRLGLVRELGRTKMRS